MSVLREVAEDGRKVGVLTRDDIIRALREYAALYGDDFPQSAFSPASAKRNGRPELVERYYAPRADGSRWPSLNAIKRLFPSWNAARAAAGFGPNSTGPASGRRKAGEAQPILTVRERLVYVSSARTVEATRLRNLAEQRAARLRERLTAAEVTIAKLRAERRPETVVRERLVRSEPKVITKTKTVRVRDDRALERARARLADERSARRALEDMARAEVRVRDREKSRLIEAEAEAVAAAERARVAEADRDRMADRLTAAESVMARLKGEIDGLRAQLLGAREAAVAADLVRQADARAERAEVRAARAERELVEQAAAITGEMRKLTQDELARLRERGPAGPQVLARALKRLSVARAGGGTDPLRAALMEIARAALTWHDRLR